MNTKICNKCKIEKPLEEFRKSGKYYRGECIECQKIYMKEYNKKNQHDNYLKNINKIKIYREKHKDKYKEYMKKYYQEHKNDPQFIAKRKDYNKTYVKTEESKIIHRLKTKEWRQNNKEHIREYSKEYDNAHREEKRKNHRKWVKNNPDKVKIYQKKDYESRKSDPILRLQRNLRNRINDSFKKQKYKKSKHTEEILGCKVNDFVLYLLETFKNNYGYEWDKVEAVHIDHIIPLSTAKTEKDVIKLCHYSNLQLLKAQDNLSKGSSLTWNVDNK